MKRRSHERASHSQTDQYEQDEFTQRYLIEQLCTPSHERRAADRGGGIDTAQRGFVDAEMMLDIGQKDTDKNRLTETGKNHEQKSSGYYAAMGFNDGKIA